MSHLKPDPRFNQYDEVLDATEKPIGFRLKGLDFFFQYDAQGGWKDEKGNSYNAEGVMIQKEEDWDDADLVDEMQDLILDEQGDSEGDEPVLSTTKGKQKKPQVNVDTEIDSIISKLKGKNHPLKVFIKTRSKREKEFKKMEIKGDDRLSINKSIASALEIVDGEERKQLEESLPKNSKIDFSVQDGDRYWFGYVITTAYQISKVLKQLSTNPNFGVLKRKTLLHLQNLLETEEVLKSRQELTTKIEALNKDLQVIVAVSNLPPKSPLSFVLDLVEECNVPLEQVYQIAFTSDTSAKICTDVKGAVLLTKLHGMKQQQAPLRVQVSSAEQKPIEGNVFNVTMEKEQHFNPKSILDCELLIPNSKEGGYVKFSKPEQGKPADYDREIHVTPVYLKRLLMYRGSDILIPIGLRLYKV